MIKDKKNNHSLDLRGIGVQTASVELEEFIREHNKEDCELTIIPDNNEGVYESVDIFNLFNHPNFSFTWTGQYLTTLVIWPKG